MNTWINKINMVSRSRRISSTRIDLGAESNQQATQPTDTRSEKPHNFFTAHRNGLVHTQRTWARTPSRLDTSEPCDFTPPRHVQTSPLDHLQPLRKNVRNIPDSKSLPLHRGGKKKKKKIRLELLKRSHERSGARQIKEPPTQTEARREVGEDERLCSRDRISMCSLRASRCSMT